MLKSFCPQGVKTTYMCGGFCYTTEAELQRRSGVVKAKIAFSAEQLGDGHYTLPIRAINTLHTTECRSTVIITR